MNLILIIIVIAAIVIALVDGLAAATGWLLWVALFVGAIALVVFLFRVITGSKRT